MTTTTTTTTEEGPLDIALREAMEAHAGDETAKGILASCFTVMKMLADGVDAATAQIANQVNALTTGLTELRDQVAQTQDANAEAAVVAAALYQAVSTTQGILDDVLVQIGWASRSASGEVTLTEDCPAEIKDRLADAASEADEAMDAFEQMTNEPDEQEGA
jgi:hypothetical protein